MHHGLELNDAGDEIILYSGEDKSISTVHITNINDFSGTKLNDIFI